MTTHHFEHRKTGPLRMFYRPGVLLCIGLAGLLISCGGNLLEDVSDDSSYEAKLEEGLMALDDEDYDKAVDLFVSLRSDYPGKEEVCVYLSNAYAGLTGIDTFNLLETIDDLQQTDDQGSIDMIGLLLGDARGVIDQQGIDDKMTLLSMAQAAIDTCIDTPDTDERVQTGLLGLGDAAMIIANLVLADQGLDSVELTEDGLNALYGSAASIDFSGDISTEDLQRLNDNLDDVRDAVGALEENLGVDEENDLADSFDEFLMALDPDGNGADIADIEHYIDNL